MVLKDFVKYCFFAKFLSGTKIASDLLYERCVMVVFYFESSFWIK